MKKLIYLFSFLMILSIGFSSASGKSIAAEKTSDLQVVESTDKDKKEAETSEIKEEQEGALEAGEKAFEEEKIENSTLEGEDVAESSKEEATEAVDDSAEEEEEKEDEEAEEPTSVIDFTEEELKMLACVVYLESGNQPFKGKVAVANTIINRVKQNGFPNTIKKVIHHRAYGYYQFSLAKPGGRLEKAMKVFGKRKIAWQKKAEKESLKAARAALYGEEAIPDHLCFFVMKNSTPGRRFRKNKPGGVIIADHYFYKW